MKRITSLLLTLVLLISCIGMMLISATAAGSPAVEGTKNGVVQVYTCLYYEGTTAHSYNPNGTIEAGTAFAVGKTGEPAQYFVTNWHVVTDDNGKVYEKAFLALDKANLRKGYNMVECEIIYTTNGPAYGEPDFAILKTKEPLSDITPLPLMPAESAQVSEKVYALGYTGFTDDLDHNIDHTVHDLTVTDGIISRFMELEGTETDTILHTALINHGNSGGPLVTERGYVAGINTWGRTATEISGGAIATDTRFFSVYIDYAMEILDVYKIPYDMYDPAGNTIVTKNGPAEPEKNYTGVIIGAVVVVAAVAAAVVLLKKEKEKAPAAAAAAKLEAVSGPLAGKSFPITAKGLTIGRDANVVDVVIPNDQAKVSRKHCKVSLDGTKVIITDLGSTHGTAVNGQKIPANVALTVETGASIELCDSDIRFVIA